MIKERYVNLEVAKLLRDKGFNEECNAIYSNNSVFYTNTICEYRNNDFNNYVTAPTQAVACDWVEEMFNISIEVFVALFGYEITIGYALKIPARSGDIIHKKDMPDGDNSDGSWSSKELAYNEALKYVLTNLV